MLSFSVMVASFWIVFWEYKTVFYILFLTEGTGVVVNLIADDVGGSEDELIVALSEEVQNWY